MRTTKIGTPGATPPPSPTAGVAMLASLGLGRVVKLMTCRSGWKCEAYPTDSDHSTPLVIGYGGPDPMAAVAQAIDLLGEQVAA